MKDLLLLLSIINGVFWMTRAIKWKREIDYYEYMLKNSHEREDKLERRLNKDGSIAKKRGRPVGSKKTS